MPMAEIMITTPFASYGCIAEVATSTLHTDGAAPAKMPPKSPLLRGEQISCTCGVSEQESGGGFSDDLAPEVTQGPPQWLDGLFTSDLFNPCPCHANVRKNECNFYCLACTPKSKRGMCKFCLTGHKGCGGQVFQIRKYMYQTCVHVEDLHHLYDTAGVQAYCINGRRAVLIHPKAAAPGQQCPVFDNTCRGCEKPLRSDCQYCSLRCKVDVQYGRALRTPDVAGLQPEPRAPMTAVAACPPSAATTLCLPSAAAPALCPPPAATEVAATVSYGSAHSSYSQWTCGGRSKKRKCEKPLRSHLG